MRVMDGQEYQSGGLEGIQPRYWMIMVARARTISAFQGLGCWDGPQSLNKTERCKERGR